VMRERERETVNCFYNDDGMGLVGLLIWRNKYQRRNGRSLHLPFHPPFPMCHSIAAHKLLPSRRLLSGQVLEIFTDCH